MARANTIKRRKYKKKMLEKVKSSVMQKLNVNVSQRYRKSPVARELGFTETQD